MPTISLCMIVKDEEDVLGRCLDSIEDLADEIIIVDTGSQDRTKEIAQHYTDKVLDFPWIDDFAAARNFSFDHATQDYVLWLDADDVLPAPELAAFRELKANLDPATHVVMMKYATAFDAAGRPSFSYYRERLLQNHAGFRWVGPIHEVIAPAGNILYSPITIHHRKLHPSDPHRNLRIFEKMLGEGQTLDARQQFYYARELYYHQRYREASRELEAFLRHPQAWLENQINACQILAYCYYRLEEEEQALTTLLRTLTWDVPRAEICCDIGKHFFDRGRYETAIFWYDTATHCQLDETQGGFVLPDCYGYIPYLQLCLCYDHLGDHQQAAACNEKAGLCKPEDSQVEQNRRYFARFSR